MPRRVGSTLDVQGKVDGEADADQLMFEEKALLVLTCYSSVIARIYEYPSPRQNEIPCNPTAEPLNNLMHVGGTIPQD